MEEEVFKYNFNRFFSIWLLHGTALILFLVLSIIGIIESGLPSITDFAVWLIFLSIIYGPHALIFLNHLKQERHTVIRIRNQTHITVIKKSFQKEFNLEDIQKVEKFVASSRTPWCIIVKWKINTHKDEVIISSLTLPRTEAFHLFKNKITYSSSFFPIFQ